VRKSECKKWTHPLCVLFINELTVDSYIRANNLDCLSRDRKDLICLSCRVQGGGIIQCARPGCFCAYHPYCAFRDSQQLVVRLDTTNTFESIRYELYCMDHRDTLNTAGFTVISSIHDIIEKPITLKGESSFCYDSTPDEPVIKRKRYFFCLFIVYLYV
jgi:PHD-like zinc-binding domain